MTRPFTGGTVPPWRQRRFRVARRYLGGLRRKYPSAYRAMRARLNAALPAVNRALDRVRDGALAAKTGKLFLLDNDAEVVCGLVIESFAWWATEERLLVSRIREAESELLGIHARIDELVTELERLVLRSDELSQRYGLRVNEPMWRDSLGEAWQEARHLFIRWGREPAVEAFGKFEDFSWYSPRPGVLDLVKIARNIGVRHTVSDTPPTRDFMTREYLRPNEPWVTAADGQAQQALSAGAGSNPIGEQAQLRSLFAGLRKVALNLGWSGSALGPLEFLTDRDLSELCAVAAGPSPDPAKDRFHTDTIRKARKAFQSRSE